MSDSPPPAYSQIDDDPFVVSPAAPVLTQPDGTQPPPINYRLLHCYGPEIPAPEDFVEPSEPPIDGKWYVVSAGKDIIVTGSWSVAADHIHRVPCVVYKTQRTWDMAIKHYAACYRAGNVKIIQPRDESSTPGRSASNAVIVHSAAPTPTRGDRTFPIYIASSPPATPTRSTPRATREDVASPIYIASSPATATTTMPAKKQVRSQSPGSVRHVNKIIDRLFDKMAKENTAGPSHSVPSQPAAWLNKSPVSILAASSSRSTASLASSRPDILNGRDVTPPSTPGNSSNIGATTDGRDPTPPSTSQKSGKAKIVVIEDDLDSDDEYFRDEIPLTAESLEALYEWEQMWELQQALSSPSFD